MQGAGIFLAIKVCCSLHPCGSPAREFPAPAHVLSLCLFVDVGGPFPGGTCELFCWIRPLGPGFTFIQSGARLVLALWPEEFSRGAGVAVSSEQCPSKIKALNRVVRSGLLVNILEVRGLSLQDAFPRC